MIREFEILNAEEKALLLKAPVVVTVLALSSFKEISQAQKDEAAKLAHMKTFTELDLLVPYYKEVDRDFKKNLEEYLERFFPFNTANCSALKEEMNKVDTIIDKLDKLYGGLLRKSLAGYARHIHNTAHSVFQDLIFPVAFSKL
jgi:hypothetical protein